MTEPNRNFSQKGAPKLRQERQLPQLTLYFPATASINIYRFNAGRLRLVRCLTGVIQQPSC